MLGGEWFEDLFGDPHIVNTGTIVQAALDALRDHLEITEEPTRVIAQVHKVGLLRHHKCVYAFPIVYNISTCLCISLYRTASLSTDLGTP